MTEQATESTMAPEADDVTTRSTTICVPPILRAIKAADEILGSDRSWLAKPGNALHERLVQLYRDHADEMLMCPDIMAIADRSEIMVNAWLAENGFSGLQLDPIPGGPDEKLAMAAILKIIVEWIAEGEVSQVDYDGTKYPAFKLKNVGFYKADTEHPVVSLPTKRDDVSIFVTILDQHPGSGFDLLDKAFEIDKTKLIGRTEYEGTIIPDVKLIDRPDVSWLKGLSTVDEQGVPAVIIQAIQETRFAMNRFGARVESAFAAGMMRCALPPQPYVVDRPFMVWCMQKGSSLPIFVGYIMPSEWQDPGDDLSKAF